MLEQPQKPLVQQVLLEENDKGQQGNAPHGHRKTDSAQIRLVVVQEQRPIGHDGQRDQGKPGKLRSDPAAGPPDRRHRLGVVKGIGKTASTVDGDPEKTQQRGEERKIVDSACPVGAARDRGIHGFRGDCVQTAGEKNVAIEFTPCPRTGEERPCRHGNQHQSFDHIQNIPAQGVHRHIGDQVFVGKNEEGVHHHPPHHHHEDIERARQQPLALLGLMRLQGDRRHDRDHVQEQHDISHEGVGQRLANHHFNPHPHGLVETPHDQARRHQTPEQARMPTAVAGVSGGGDAGSRDHQERDQVTHGGAKEGAGKHCGSQSKHQQQTNSTEDRRDGTQRHRLP